MNPVPNFTPAPKPPVHAKNPKFLAWIRTQRCWMCMQVASRQQGPTEAAHMESRRYGDEANAIPACAFHHREGPNSLHRLGKRWETVWTSKKLLAQWYWMRYQEQV